MFGLDNARLMNAKELLFACLGLIIGSILLVPVSARMGVGSDAATTLSSLSLVGGIATAFMTVKKEKDRKRTGGTCKKP